MTPPKILIVQESAPAGVYFETIQRNLSSVDFGLVLPDIMLIADEVDSQLTRSIGSFMETTEEGTAA